MLIFLVDSFSGTERDIIPSIQALINCGDAGTCQGGDSGAANKWVYKNGIPDVTCQAYEAINKECSDINMCMNCDHDTTKGCCKSSSWFSFFSWFALSSLFLDSPLSAAIKKYPKVQVSEYGTVRGDDNIMSEIYARGPVSAYLNAECIMDYTSGESLYLH